MTIEMEYIGEVLPEGRLSIDPDIASKLNPGQKLKVKIQKLPDEPRTQKSKKLDPATKRVLATMKNAPRLGLIQGSITREEIYGDRIDERY